MFQLVFKHPLQHLVIKLLRFVHDVLIVLQLVDVFGFFLVV